MAINHEELQLRMVQAPGGLPRKPAPNAKTAPPAITAGVLGTPEQIEAQSRVVDRQRMRENARQGKEAIGQALDAVGGAIGQVGRTVAGTVGAAGSAIANTTFTDELPDYRTVNGRGDLREGLDQRQAREWVEQNPQTAAYARSGMQVVSHRAVDAAHRPFGIPRPMQIAGAQGVAVGGNAGGDQAETVQAPAQQASQQPADIPGDPVTGSAPAPVDPQGEWGGTGIGVGAQGGEIVGRVNADGIAEFSNVTADQGAASGKFSATGLRPQLGNVPTADQPRMGLPGGARMLASGSNVSSGEEEFARLGSAANVGNDIGSFSQNTAGDAALARDRFERANAERAKMVEISRRGEPRGLTVVGTGSKMTPDELLQANLGLRQREADRADRALKQQAIDAGLDRTLRERELVGTEQRNALDAQRTQQEIEQGNLTLAQQRQLANLYARYEQAPPEERSALAEQIRTLTGKEAPNRFTVVSGGQEYDTSAGALVNRPSRVFNNQTGQFVDGGRSQSGAPRRTSVSMAEVEQTAKARGLTNDQVIQTLKAAGVGVGA